MAVSSDSKSRVMVDLLQSNIVKRGLIVLVFCLLILLAWNNRFVQDDAFISFRYAENFAKGNGLVWNTGETSVEGYTNFLWTVLVGVGIYLKIDPVIFSYALGLSFYSLTLIIVFKLANLVLDSEFLSLITVILLSTNYTFSVYATGGLETSMQACLLAGVIYLSMQVLLSNQWGVRKLLFISLLSSLAILTRLDSAIILGVTFVGIFYRMMTTPSPIRKKLISASALVLPALLIVSAWLVWTFFTYGDILPNTFYVKVTSNSSILRGGLYVILFFVSYWIFPVGILALFGVKWIISKFRIDRAILAAAVIIWCAYIAYVGGDFMEFRLFVPILPYLFILMTWFIFGFVNKPVFQAAFIALIVLGSLSHALLFTTTRNIGSISELTGYMINPDQDWPGVGSALGKYFQDETNPVTIAVRPAGAIPYYSKLRTLDMLGLNDRYIAKNGLVISSIPGHQRTAPFKYMLQNHVNLVIGHPIVNRQSYHSKTEYSLAEIKQMFSIPDISADLIPSTAEILEIPINAEYKVTVLYLIQNKVVDQAIQKYALAAYPVTINNGQTLK